MLKLITQWFPDREIILLGDTSYSTKHMLRSLPGNTNYIGRIRSDIEINSPLTNKKTFGRPRTKGKRLPSPLEVTKKADSGRVKKWEWEAIEVCAYGVTRPLLTISYTGLWPLSGRVKSQQESAKKQRCFLSLLISDKFFV